MLDSRLPLSYFTVRGGHEAADEVLAVLARTPAEDPLLGRPGSPFRAPLWIASSSARSASRLRSYSSVTLLDHSVRGCGLTIVFALSDASDPDLRVPRWGGHVPPKGGR